jgi:hypothetical protein
MDKLSDFEEGYVITIKKGGFFSSEEIKVRLCFGCGKGIEELGIPYTFISYKEIYLKEKNLINNKEAIIKYSDRLDKDATANDKRRSKEYDREEKRIKNTKKKIVNLLKKQKSKMPTSDIDAFLKHKDVDEIKDLCEEMYHDGKISRTGNYRYFVLSK